MPSTVVHVAVGLLVAAGILGSAYDERALLVVGGAAALPDLDVFASLLVESTHRAALHTLVVPAAAVALLYYDTRVREASWLRARYDARGVQLAWASIASFTFAGVGLDLFTALGVNVFYPFYDQFVSLDGTIGYSTEEGLFQTFVEVTTDQSAGGSRSVDVGQRGSTRDVHVGSGVDPQKGTEPAGTRRVFPVAYRGWHLSLLAASVLVTWLRLRWCGAGADGS